MFFENSRLQQAWDNTSISVFKDCPRKYYFSTIQGWRARGISPPLAWGGAMHDCYEVYDKAKIEGASTEAALCLSIRRAFELAAAGFGDDNRRTLLTLLRSIVWYSEQYASDVLQTYRFPNGRVGLEMSFSFPLPFSPAGSTTPYYYSGHIDKLALYSDSLYAVERKSTTVALSEQFFARYTHSAQIGGYVYAGKVIFDTQVSGAIIEATQVGVNFTRFGRLVVHRINDLLEEWMGDLHQWIRWVESCHKEDYWPANTESCSKYNGCQFRNVCSKNRELRPLMLETDFVQNRWNPLVTRGDV